MGILIGDLEVTIGAFGSRRPGVEVVADHADVIAGYIIFEAFGELAEGEERCTQGSAE